MSEEAPDRTPRAPAVVVEQRINRVIDLLLNGAMFSDLLQLNTEEGWGLKERHLRNYLQRASEIMAEQVERDRSRLLDLHMCMRSRLYAEAKQAGEYRVCLDILRDLGTMQNLYPPKASVSEVNLNATGGPKYTDDEFQALLASRRAGK